jgi:hypothetical protein
MKKTAVDYLFEKLWGIHKDKFTWQMILNEAKKKEKQQIEDSFDFGFCEGYNYAIRDYNPDYISGEEYYKETYESK